MIVVGIDGSKTAVRALRWAASEARERGERLRLVHVFMPPAQWAPYAFATDYAYDLEAEARQQAEDLLAGLVKDLAEELESVEHETVVVGDYQTARALVEQARDARLLVVGTRGLGGFRELILGSVSHQVVQHAPCPVVVIRPGEGDLEH